MSRLPDMIEKLDLAWQRLDATWQVTRSVWQDQDADRFEREAWGPVEKQTQATLKALRKLDQVVAHIRRLGE